MSFLNKIIIQKNSKKSISACFLEINYFHLFLMVDL
jgi:hypothetical protein